MKNVLCKVTFSSPTHSDQMLELVGELNIEQVISRDNELVAVESRFFSENKLVIKHSILHKADISQIQVFKEKKIFTFEKNSLRLMSQVLSFKGMEA